MDGLAQIANIGGHAEQARHARLVGVGRGHLRPFAHALANFMRGHVLRGHHARFAPAARHGIGIGEVLARLDGVVAATNGIRQDMDATLGLSGKREGKPDIGSGDFAFPVAQQRCRFGIAGLAGHGEGEAERGARAVFAQCHRVLESLRSGGEAACVEIGIGQAHAVRGILRLCSDGGFGSLHLRAGGKLAGLRRRDIGARRHLSGTTAKHHRRHRGGHAESYRRVALFASIHV